MVALELHHPALAVPEAEVSALLVAEPVALAHKEIQEFAGQAA